MQSLATNRQKKLLRFFGVEFSPNITNGAAGWEISNLLSDDFLRDKWRKYLYLTSDFDSDSDQLRPFTLEQLAALTVPDNWHSSSAVQKFKDEVVANLLENAAPFDNPEPSITFVGAIFAFTGKFTFGTREECQNAVIANGGAALESTAVNRKLTYLVIGTQGSPAYKRGSYGTKIEKAILSRREFGAPAIISEDHWVQELSRTR